MLSSSLALLGYTRQCAVFQNQSVPEVVEQVLRQHGLEGPDFEFRLERSYPARELITQWREIQQATDMTLEMLNQVDWVQVLTDAATAIGVILVAVGVGVLVVTLGIPEAIIGAFLLIVRLAISAWGTLAAILGAGTTVAVAP